MKTLSTLFCVACLVAGSAHAQSTGTENNGLSFAYTVSPQQGSLLEILPEVTFTFAGLDTVAVSDINREIPELTLDGNPMASGLAQISVTGNKLKLSFGNGLQVSMKHTFAIKFAAGDLTGANGDAEGVNGETIGVSYTLAAPVEDDLSIDYAEPTQPNENGQISAATPLTTIYFESNEKGLIPANGDTENVTVTGPDGYTASATLKESTGNNPDYSYFKIDFDGDEPTVDGLYTIEIAPGSFGDDVWMLNPELGHTNPDLTLSFTLIDGNTSSINNIESVSGRRDIYTLTGVKIIIPESGLPSGLYVINGKTTVK